MEIVFYKKADQHRSPYTYNINDNKNNKNVKNNGIHMISTFTYSIILSLKLITKVCLVFTHQYQVVHVHMRMVQQCTDHLVCWKNLGQLKFEYTEVCTVHMVCILL